MLVHRYQVEIKTDLSNIRWSQMESDGVGPGWIPLRTQPRTRGAGPKKPWTAETVDPYRRSSDICVGTEYRNPSGSE